MDSITVTLPDFATWTWKNWLMLYPIIAGIIWFPWHFSTLIRTKIAASKSESRNFEKGRFLKCSFMLFIFGPLIMVIVGIGLILNPIFGALGLVFAGEWEHPFDISVREILAEWLTDDWKGYARTPAEIREEESKEYEYRRRRLERM